MNWAFVSVIVSVNFMKLLVTLALFLLILAHLSIHQPTHVNSHSNENTHLDSGWVQPDNLTNNYPSAVGIQQSNLNFQRIENQFLAYQNHGLGIEVNTTLLGLLKDISSMLTDVDASDKVRLNFLIRKALPLKSGEEFILILDSYLSYVASEQILLERISQADSLNKPKLLKNFKNSVTQLQMQFFEQDTAQRLFSRQNLTTNYFYQRQFIKLQTQWPANKKQAMLENVEKEYKAALDELE